MSHGPSVTRPSRSCLCLAVGLFGVTAADAGAPAAPPPPITIGRVPIGGYIQADAIFSEAADDDSEPAGTFEIPRARVWLSGESRRKCRGPLSATSRT